MRRRAIHFALLLLAAAAALSGGCDRHASEPSDAPPVTSGASPEHYEQTAATVKPVSAVQVPSAPRPTGPLPKDASCVSAACHATFATAAYVHGPVSSRSCTSCHADDVGGHKYPLKRSGNETCTFCHAVSGSESHQHKALEQGCQSCHDPHASQTKFLLTADSVEQLCAKCHQVPLKKFAHEPFARGQCTACHQPHQSENAFLLRGGEGAKFCLSCHGEMKEKLAKVAAVSNGTIHKPVANCQLCHDPHSSDFENQLRRPVEQTCLTSCHRHTTRAIQKASVPHAAVSIDASCANCHDPHASTHAPLLKARMDDTCLSCHNKPIRKSDGHVIANMYPVLKESRYLHGAIRVGDCSACHQPHGGSEHALLNAAFPRSSYASFAPEKYALCLQSCHQPQLVTEPKTTTLTNFRDGDKNLHYVHVNRDEKGRSCKTCHAIHGSNEPNHMASEVPFERSGWAMPIGFEKKSDGGSCSPGCHTPRTYHRSAAATTRPATRGAT